MGAPSSGGVTPFNTKLLTNEYSPPSVPLNCLQSKNSMLYGMQNPKSLIPPPMAPPLGDLEFWKANDWTTHSHVNTRNLQYEDEYLGYDHSKVNYNSSIDSVPLTKEEIALLPYSENFISELQDGIFLSLIHISEPTRRS